MDLKLKNSEKGEEMIEEDVIQWLFREKERNIEMEPSKGMLIKKSMKTLPSSIRRKVLLIKLSSSRALVAISPFLPS